MSKKQEAANAIAVANAMHDCLAEMESIIESITGQEAYIVSVVHYGKATNVTVTNVCSDLSREMLCEAMEQVSEPDDDQYEACGGAAGIH